VDLFEHKSLALQEWREEDESQAWEVVLPALCSIATACQRKDDAFWPAAVSHVFQQYGAQSGPQHSSGDATDPCPDPLPNSAADVFVAGAEKAFAKAPEKEAQLLLTDFLGSLGITPK
jgi:hypothetical protein